MSALNQKTIKKAILFEGVGLHTGKPVVMKINPAEVNTGIIFKRNDLKKNNLVIPEIEALAVNSLEQIEEEGI